jgi:hypothetical protein
LVRSLVADHKVGRLPLSFSKKREYKLFGTLLPAAAAHESYTFA